MFGYKVNGYFVVAATLLLVWPCIKTNDCMKIEWA